jgi:3-hydroxybutyryl-CoA dehydrogenase
MSADECVVIGGGTMGRGIAHVLFASPSHPRVHIVERDAETAVAAVEAVLASLDRARSRDGDAELTPDERARIVGVTELPEGVAPVLVVEAVPEDVALKADVLGRASRVWADALLASNTSSLSITELATAVEQPERFLGMHFFNPVPRSALVEIVTHDGVRTDVVDDARAWVERIGKESIVVRDAPGFATSRLGLAIGLEAIRMLEEGVASAADIDRGMVLGYRFPMGPLELTDLVGLDVRLAIADHLSATLGPRFEPPGLLRSKVAAGDLGQKSGKGFYDWSEQS